MLNRKLGILVNRSSQRRLQKLPTNTTSPVMFSPPPEILSACSYQKKSIRPLHTERPLSTKWNDRCRSINSDTISLTSDNQDNVCNISCLCRECGNQCRKTRRLQFKFRKFKPEMHYAKLRRKQLVKRFKACALMVIATLRSSRLKRKAVKKRLQKFKTTQFDIHLQSPKMSIKQQGRHTITQKSFSTEPTGKNTQLKILESKHRSKQSIQFYVQQKLQDIDQSHNNQNTNTLPSLKEGLKLKRTIGSCKVINSDMDRSPCSSLSKVLYYSPNQKSYPNSPYINPDSMRSIVVNHKESSSYRRQNITSRQYPVGSLGKNLEVFNQSQRSQGGISRRKPWTEKNFMTKS